MGNSIAAKNGARSALSAVLIASLALY